jgi:hypothetical protein
VPNQNQKRYAASAARTALVAHFIRPLGRRNRLGGLTDSLRFHFDLGEQTRISEMVATVGESNDPDLAASRRVAGLLLDEHSTPGRFGEIMRRREAKTPKSISAAAEMLIYLWRHGEEIMSVTGRRDC